ncbi:peptidase [Phycobium rhodophyticola]
MRLNQGLIFMSDSRTNAGVDNFATSRKMFTWSVPGERSITIMTAGNLATTQAMISLLQERSEAVEDRDPGILNQPSMFQVARLVGATLKEVISYSSPTGQTSDDRFSASVIVGGQIKGGPPTVFLIYPAGNFIEVTEDTPFFQIGETKYGKPILVRAFDPELSFDEAMRLLLVSFDSTVKSICRWRRRSTFMSMKTIPSTQTGSRRIEEGDEVYRSISEGWGDALKMALEKLPTYDI